MGTIQSTEGLNRSKSRGSWNWSLLFCSWLTVELGHLISPCSGTGIYIMSFSCFQNLKLKLNCITAYPLSPACKEQIVGFFSSYNCMSKFLIINLLLYPLSSVNLRILTQTVKRVDMDGEKLEPTYTAGGEVNWCKLLWKTGSLKIESPYNTAIPILSMYPIDKKTYVRTNTCI